jgi:hypothetical protein
MDRRDLLKGAAAASLIGSFFGPQAMASSELTLDARLEHLERHTGLMAARSPSPLITRGLRAAGLSETSFSDILAGLLFARVFKECSGEEQKDARWMPVMERIVPRFTESLAALMERTQVQSDSRAVRRMLRRPNKLARIVNHGLLGKTTARDQELRQALGALAAEPNPLGDLYQGFDAAAEAAGTTRVALAVPTSQAVADQESGAAEGETERAPVQKHKLLVGVLLLLGAPLVLIAGIYGAAIGLMGGVAAIAVLGFALCLAAVVMVIFGIVYIVKGIIEMRRSAVEAEELSDRDLLLLGDVEDLLAA